MGIKIFTKKDFILKLWEKSFPFTSRNKIRLTDGNTRPNEEFAPHKDLDHASLHFISIYLGNLCSSISNVIPNCNHYISSAAKSILPHRIEKSLSLKLCQEKACFCIKIKLKSSQCSDSSVIFRHDGFSVPLENPQIIKIKFSIIYLHHYLL